MAPLNMQMQGKPLTKKALQSRLSLVAKTLDGTGYALTKLDISDCNVTSFGKVIDEGYDHLRYVDANGNRLIDVSSLSSLKSLLACNLADNMIQEVPSFTNEWLQAVNLAKNRLKTLEGIEGPAITYLNANDNYLVNLEGIETLPQLKVVEASNNELSHIFLDRVPSNLVITDLDLSDNSFLAFPDLTAIPDLTHLDLSRNQIQRLTPDPAGATAAIDAKGGNETKTEEALLTRHEGLTVLLLDGNSMATEEDLKAMRAFPNLRTLSIIDTPLMGLSADLGGEGEVVGARVVVLSHLMNLDTLNGVQVGRPERRAALSLFRKRQEEKEYVSAPAASSPATAGEPSGAGDAASTAPEVAAPEKA